MKPFACSYLHNSREGRTLFIYFASGPENFFSETVSQKEKSAEKKETVTDYKPVTDEAYFQGQIDTEISNKKTELNGKMEEIQKDIAAIAEDDPEKETKKKKLEQVKANIQAEIDGLPEYKSKLEKAKKKAVEKITAAYKKRNEAIKKEAEEYTERLRKSLTLEMETAAFKERDESAEGDYKTIEAQIMDHARRNRHTGEELKGRIGKSLFAEGMAMQQFLPGAEAVGQAREWNQFDNITMCTEAIQTIYEEQGKEAADTMVDKIEKARLEGVGGKNEVNWFTYHNAFKGAEFAKDGGDDSVFAYVHKKMGVTVEHPKVFGHVLGKMQSADKYFADKKAPKAFAAYEKYVQEQLKDKDYVAKLADGSNEKDIMTPSEWLQQYKGEDAKEVLEEVVVNKEKNRDKFIDNLMADLKLPEKDSHRYGLIRAAIDGALWASKDPSEWDALARQVLTKMMGGTFDVNKLNLKDIETDVLISEYSERFGDKKIPRALGDKGLIYVAGLLEGAKQQYGKNDPEFLKRYQKFVEEKLKFDGSLMEKVRQELEFAGGEKGLRNSPEHQENIRELLDKNIRAAYNYYEDIGGSEKQKEITDRAVAMKSSYDSFKQYVGEFNVEGMDGFDAKAEDLSEEDVASREKALRDAMAAKFEEYNKAVNSEYSNLRQMLVDMNTATAKRMGAPVGKGEKLMETFQALQLPSIDKVLQEEDGVDVMANLAMDLNDAKQKIEAWKKEHANELAPFEKWYNDKKKETIARYEHGPKKGGGAPSQWPSAAPKSSPATSQEGLESFAVADVKVEDLKEKPKVGKPKEKAPGWAQKEAEKDEKAGWKKYTRGKESVIVHVPEKKTDDEKTEFYDPAEKPA